ncbi:hypothetical protein BDM02DRAFT_2059034 [Thelephora ganbajun]|uniref:Uncharacterized protein n=1 Tax=Thelephora ganbajun TaxID=370292 RepID=A0ACB6ZGN0_THEGA|nr:hypothetical protein BDM02DRAFT_2059034 [Thelephora ganbajun]
MFIFTVQHIYNIYRVVPKPGSHSQRGPCLSLALLLCYVRRPNISKVEAMWGLLLLFGIPVCLYLFFRPRPTDPRPAGLRPTDVYKQFLIGPQPYALITEATDDLGKALAKELYDSGFNLIIHGRNKEKILSVIDELKNSSPSGGDVRYFVANANTRNKDIKRILKKFEGLNVTVVARASVWHTCALHRNPHMYTVCCNFCFHSIVVPANSQARNAIERPNRAGPWRDSAIALGIFYGMVFSRPIRYEKNQGSARKRPVSQRQDRTASGQIAIWL